MKGGGLVVGAAPLDLAELDVGDGHGLDDGEQLVGVHPGGLGPVADGDELDGAGDDRLELLVGALAPLELSGVHHEDVDVTVAHGGFAGWVVVVDADGGVDGVALCLHGGGEPAGVAPVSPTSLVPGPVSRSAGRAMAAATARSISSSDTRKARERPRWISRAATSQTWRAPFMPPPPPGTARRASELMREGHQIGVALRGGDHRQIGTLIDAQARFPSCWSTTSTADDRDQSGAHPR